ncbi:ABC transporter permease [Maribacter sp. R77961]|uniref:ABC transporter permease n=1 Tax=Maribacter sp. R77961 TaxID=3093871 RepID=UPI0037C9517A
MFKNYLKIAWRNLLRNRGFSVLNIAGLSIGLAATALIVLWVDYELSFNKFHERGDRIYQVYNQYPVDGEIWTWNSTPKIMGPTIKKDFPEVERVSRYNYDDTYLFSVGDKRMKATGTIVDPDFLYMFSFPLINGSRETVLADVNSLVVTETFAKELFGENDPMGQVVKIDNNDVFKISGVLKDLPSNSGFHFKFLIPWSYLKQIGHDDKHWGNNSIATYIMLKENTDYASFLDKIGNLREIYDKDSADMVTYPYPFFRNYLYGEFENGEEVGGRIAIIRLFSIIAFIILLIACINFMNLSTARSEKRAKEVGIRKVIGAQRGGLISQFMGESILLSVLSALFAFVLVLLVLPKFNELLQTEVRIDYTDPIFWSSALGIIVFTGLLAGSYPALYLSAFKPISVLKGTFQKLNSKFSARKVLVVVQFAAAIVFITSTLIVKQQLNKVQNRQMGYSKDNLIYTYMEGDVKQKYQGIRNELIASGAATSVTRTVSPVTENWSNSWDMEWQGKDFDDKTLILRFTAGEAIAKTLGLEVLAGRDLNHTLYPSDSTAMLINETAAEHMGFDEPIGNIVKDMGMDWRIIGVVKDFVFTSPFQKIEPVIIHGNGEWTNFIHLKLNPKNTMSQNLAQVESIFEKFNPEYPFNYEFVDQQYANKFIDEQRTQTLANLSALLTIFISCLGLFGLASYMAENRIKEIGVRKVLGASVQSIASLLSLDFLKLVLISVTLAVPISWYLMSKWLQDFAYRVTISWWTFALAGVLALVIAFLTVSYQAVKAAIVNPVDSLRDE